MSKWGVTYTSFNRSQRLVPCERRKMTRRGMLCGHTTSQAFDQEEQAAKKLSERIHSNRGEIENDVALEIIVI